MAILTTTTNGLNFIGGTTYIQTGTTTLMSIAVDGSIAFNEYGAGYLKTDASGNITADNTGGGLPGGPYVTIGTNQTITGIKSFSSKIGADGGIDGLTLANGGITGSNYDITGVNQLVISDPGEGIVFTGTATMYLNAVDDATDSILKLTNATQLNLNSTARITSLVNPTGAQDAATKNYVDTEIGNIPSGLAFEGNWNASTDTPTLAGTTQDNGKFWIVSVAGSTNLSGITDWAVGDWAIYVDNGAGTDAWQKVDNSSTLSGLGAAGKVAFWSTTSNVSFNNNFSYDGTYLTSPRIRVGDGTDGFFYSESAGRTAFTGGDFYIQSGVTNYFNYATNIYLGDNTGDNVLFRGSTITGTNWDITPAGAISASSTIYSAGGFLVPYAAATKKPMINLAGATTYGLWHTEGSNDIFSFDFGGVSKHQFFQTGNAVFAGEVQAASLDINGAGDFSGKVDFQGTAAIEGGSGYGVFKGYTTNDNHFIAVRGIVANTATLSITGGHQTTFVEHADSTSEGWYFKSKTTGAYREIARIDGTNQMFLGGNKVWNAGNDGAGSGLDADLLDGINSTSFLRSDAVDTASQRIVFSANATNNWDTIATGSGNQGSIEIYNTGGGNDAFMAFHTGGDYALYFGLDADTNQLSVGGWSMGANKYKIWHAGNDGSGSGLDADLLDGYHASTSRASANTIPIRDGNGYLNLGWINTTSGNTTSTISDVYVNTNDGYIRKATKSHFRSQLTDGVYLPIAGTAADSNLLDGKDHTNFGATLATYGTTAGSSGRIRITAPFNTNSSHMFQVTVSIYSGYTIHTYVVGGYMYSSINNWYLPKVVYSGTGTPDIKVGRDSNGKAYISIANGNYTGVRVHNMTRGYQTSVADTYDPWTITIDAALPNVLSPDIYTTWTSGNDGAGSGLDADLLDGQQGSYYAPASGGNYWPTSGSWWGSNMPGSRARGTQDSGGEIVVIKNNPSNGRSSILVDGQFYAGENGGFYSLYSGNSYNNKVGFYGNSSGHFYITTTNVKANGNTMWHAGNDGAGSGLDADTVDGYQATSLLKSDENDAFTGTLTMGTQKALVANNYGRGVYGIYSSTRYQHVWSMGTAYNIADNGSDTGNLYGLAYTHTNVGGQSKPGLSHQLLVMTNGVTKTAIGSGIWTSGSVNIGGGTNIAGDLVASSNSFMSGYLKVTGDIRGNGQELVLNAGESYAYATGQTSEHVYVNAEAGLIISSSPDNWSSGWAGRNNTYINRADGTSSFTGKISVQGSNVIEIDQGTSSFNHVSVLSNFGSKLFSATNYGYVLESSAVPANPVTFRFDNDRYRIYSGSSGEALTVLANKKVGINNTAPGYQLDVSGNARFTGTTVHSAGLYTSGTNTRNKISVWSSLSTYTIGMKNGFGYGGLGGDSTGTDYAMSFQMSNDTNRGWWWGDSSHSDVQGAMSLTTQGKLVVATSIKVGAGEGTRSAGTSKLTVVAPLGGIGADFQIDGGSGFGTKNVRIEIPAYGEGLQLTSFAASSLDNNAITFYQDANKRGSIVVNATSTSYNTTSDYRLKENKEIISDAIERVKALKPVKFNWISEPSQPKIDGFYAHELAEVVPEAVTGEKDALDHENNPDYQSIDQSKIVPLLSAALQQAVDKIEELEQRIQLIENK
jgi:hypothetical protein